jgi:hypothetical protein
MNNAKIVGLAKHSSPMIVAKLHTMLDNAWMCKDWKSKPYKCSPQVLTRTVYKVAKDLKNGNALQICHMH